jgi:PAS domain S-box-containing protein
VQLELQNEALLQAREELEQWRNRYLDLYEFAPVAYFTLDDRNQILEVNLTGSRLIGIERDELLKKRFTEFITPEFASAFHLSKRRAPRGEVAETCTLSMRNSRGEPFPAQLKILAVDGEQVRIAVLDITEVARLEEELRIRSYAITSATIGIAFSNLDGRLTYLNPACLRMWGYENEREALGKHAKTFCADEADARMVKKGTVKEGKWQGELKAKRSDSSTFDAYISANLVVDTTGKPICLMTFCVDITQRKNVEAELTKYREHLEELVQQRTEELRRSNEQLETHIAQRVEAEKQVRSLSHRLVEAQDRERRAIGHFLHDELGSILVMLKLAVRQARKKLGENAMPELEEIERIANEAAEQIRTISSSMRPTMLDDFGLLEAVQWYLDRYENSTGIKPDFTHSGMGDRLPSEIENVAFRIVQEALTNVAKHAKVKSVDVVMSCDEGVLTLSVEDNGSGFDPETVGEGSGIGGMQDLAALVGGSLVIDSCPGEGTRITGELPYLENK